MAIYDRQIATALRLIAKYGEMVQWVQVRDVAPDPEKPWETGGQVRTSKDVKICFLPITAETMKTVVFLKGTEVQAGSVMGYMGAVDFEPSAKDIVNRGGELRIENLDCLAPNGRPILYTVVFKQ